MTQCFISVSGVKTTKDLGGLREVKMQSILVKLKKTNSSVTDSASQASESVVSIKLWVTLFEIDSRFIFIFTFYCIFCSVTRSTVSVWSQFPSCKGKLRNVVGFDLYRAAVQHSCVNNKGRSSQSQPHGSSRCYTAVSLPTRAIIKVAEAESIRSSSSAAKPFIKTSNTSPRWMCAQ